MRNFEQFLLLYYVVYTYHYYALVQIGLRQSTGPKH